MENENMMHRLETGRLKVMERINRKLYRVEIWALNDKTNRNGWRYINLEQHLGEFQDVPILTAYLRDGRQIGDGHNYDMRTDPKTGEQYASFTGADAERIVGWVPKDANIRIETEDDTNWIVVTGYLWTWYSRELVEKIAGQGGGMEVSVETLVTREHKEGDVDVEEEWIILGVTVLGDGVAPAVAGANIQSLAELRSSMKQEILKAASYINEPENNDRKVIHKMIPTMNMLAEMSKNFPGYTCVGLSEDGLSVALLSEQNRLCSYLFGADDKGTVLPEKIKDASALLQLATENGQVDVNMEAVLNNANARGEKLAAENARLTQENKDMSAKIEAMEKRESARRLQAAKAAVTAELARRNENRADGEKFSAALCEKLMQRIEANEFTDMVDKNGNWTGDKAVCEAVAVLCMDEQTRMDKAAKSKELRYHSWKLDEGADDQPSTIGDRLRANAAQN